ncbi:MAG: type VI secretion system tip protein TssI/VgrG, partial [Myxococcota bacterium]
LFEHPDDGDADAPGRERVIIADVAALTPEIAGGAALRFVGDTDALTAAHAPFDGITRLGRTRRLRPQRVLQGDYDFRRPGLPNLTKAEARDPRAAGVGGSQLRMRPHAAHAEIEDAAPAARFEDARAQWTLEQHRSRRDEASGASTSRRLVPGHRFTVEDHPLEHLNVGYLVRSVVHEGTVAELSDALDVDTYHNTFTFVPEAVAPRPPVWPHPHRSGPETATVVGAEGEAISTDDQGRIRVQFHWDLAERPPDRRSCWIRVAQPWAGTHFGAQFIPRVGDEVVVSFLGGDPDRPLCTGSVYNGTHPTPFDLPDAKATSGFRTQSTPGGEGYNELSFDDAAGEERVYLHAERDLVADVGRNHHVTVTGTQTLVAHGHQALVATLGQSMQVGGAQVVNVLGDHQVSAAGSSLQSVTGDAEVTVGRRRNVVVEGHDRVEVKGAAQAVYGDDHTVRVAGHQTTIVGAHDARRSHTLHVEGSATTHGTGTVRITSDKELELAVGDSVIRLTSDGIELRAPNLRLCGETLATRATDALNLEAPEQITLKSKKVLMESEAAFLGLAKVAKLKGELVKLNCTDDPVDALDPPEAPKRTTIALSDETGAPLSGQRFIVVLADGTETTGTLDDKGEAELVLDQSGEVIFPDVHRPRPA